LTSGRPLDPHPDFGDELRPGRESSHRRHPGATSVVVPPARRADIEARPPGHPGVGVRQGRRRSLAARPESISPAWVGLSQRTRARTIAETTTRYVFLTDSDTSIVQRSMTPSRTKAPSRVDIDLSCPGCPVDAGHVACGLGGGSGFESRACLTVLDHCIAGATDGLEIGQSRDLSSWVVVPDLIADHSGLLCAWCSPPRR
jgi:hypothetical protein